MSNAPRPPTLWVERAGNSKGLGGTFDPQNSEPSGQTSSRARVQSRQVHNAICDRVWAQCRVAGVGDIRQAELGFRSRWVAGV
jgi:hypothetical protein